MWLQQFFASPQLSRQALNPWQLSKSRQIKCLLVRLGEHLQGVHWQVDNSQPTHSDGIYLAHPREAGLRAYLHVHGQQPGRAGLHLEFLAAETATSSLEIYEDLTTAQLAELLLLHFGVGDLVTG